MRRSSAQCLPSGGVENSMTLVTLSKKISQITLRHLGCSVEILDGGTGALGGPSLASTETDHIRTALRNTKASRIYSGLDVIVPLCLEGNLQYIGVIKKGFQLKPEHVDTLTKAIRNIISAYHDDDNMLGHLDEYTFTLENSMKTKNVIDLSSFRRKKTGEGASNFDASNFDASNLIVTSDLENAQRMAIQAFHKSNCSGLVSWNDLNQQSMLSIHDILELGQITIFVQDLSQMSPQHQDLIEEYFSMKPRPGTPRFVVGVPSTYKTRFSHLAKKP